MFWLPVSIHLTIPHRLQPRADRCGVERHGSSVALHCPALDEPDRVAGEEQAALRVGVEAGDDRQPLVKRRRGGLTPGSPRLGDKGDGRSVAVEIVADGLEGGAK